MLPTSVLLLLAPMALIFIQVSMPISQSDGLSLMKIGTNMFLSDLKLDGSENQREKLK